MRRISSAYLFDVKVPKQVFGPTESGETEFSDLYFSRMIVKYRRL